LFALPKQTTGLICALAIALITLAILGVSAPAALAAPPTNDTFAGATPAALGFSEVLDTTEATTDSDDAQLNATCGAPATDASVWYAFTGSDIGVVVDVSSSNYSAGVLVGVGSQGSLSTVACGPGSVAFFAASATTYYVLAIDDQFDGGGNGGSLSISFSELPPPPTIDLTIDAKGTFDKQGLATISGTVTCSSPVFVVVQGQVTQRVGRINIVGEFFTFVFCDGETAWQATLQSPDGKFAGGRVTVDAFAFDAEGGPNSDFATATVQLKGARALPSPPPPSPTPPPPPSPTPIA